MQVGTTFNRGVGLHEHLDAPIPGICEVTLQALVHIKEVAVKDLIVQASKRHCRRRVHGNDHIPCNAFANPDVY